MVLTRVGIVAGVLRLIRAVAFSLKVMGVSVITSEGSVWGINDIVSGLSDRDIS